MADTLSLSDEDDFFIRVSEMIRTAEGLDPEEAAALVIFAGACSIAVDSGRSMAAVALQTAIDRMEA